MTALTSSQEALLIDLYFDGGKVRAGLTPDEEVAALVKACMLQPVGVCFGERKSVVWELTRQGRDLAARLMHLSDPKLVASVAGLPVC